MYVSRADGVVHTLRGVSEPLESSIRVCVSRAGGVVQTLRGVSEPLESV